MVNPPPFFEFDSDDEEDFDSEIWIAMLVAIALGEQSREPKEKFKRMDFDEHVRLQSAVNMFHRLYHMSVSSFHKLVELLKPHLEVDKHQAGRAGGAIPLPMVVGMGLRYLDGMDVKHIADRFGISNAACYEKTKKFVVAVDNALPLPLPTTPDELKELALAWDGKSGAFGAYYGCVGAIDGWLCCTNKPVRVHNPAHYYSGHYQRHGVNVQAIADSNLRFLYFGVIGPGRMNDGRAFSNCLELQAWLKRLPAQYFLVGDNAYPLSDKVLIPFSGAAKHVLYNRSYNFYLSQLRIRVEMAFGLLTTKWRIFRKDIEVKDLPYLKCILRAAAKLHNYVIDNDGTTTMFGQNHLMPNDYGIEALTENSKGYLNTLPTKTTRGVVFEDRRRKNIVNEIVSMQLKRPADNEMRNYNEELDAESIVEIDIEDDIEPF